MITVVGSAGFGLALAPMAQTFNDLIGALVQDVKVVGKPGEQMPTRSDGGPAYGFWKATIREIWLWDEIDQYPAAKTLAHEACHVLDGDWFTRQQRRDIMALMEPKPTAWGDQTIDGVLRKYVALPSECFAVYGSAALGGFDKPAYRSLFVRRIVAANWPKLRELALKDYGHAVPEPDPIPPPPTPPDPGVELKARIADLEAALTAIKTIAAGKVEA